MKMSGGGLEHTYWAHSFHFHWGLDKMHGTEHKINGNQYALEVCIIIIHYITSKVCSWLKSNLLPMALALFPDTIASKDVAGVSLLVAMLIRVHMHQAIFKIC